VKIANTAAVWQKTYKVNNSVNYAEYTQAYEELVGRSSCPWTI